MSTKFPIDPVKFKKLFVNREDTYAVQHSTGKGYMRVKRVLDLKPLKTIC